MKISAGLNEDGVVVGNTYNKYHSQNPLVRYIMQGFLDTLSELVSTASPCTIHEIGCGEGFLTLNWKKQGIQARGSDFSSQVIKLARANAVEQGFTDQVFNTRSIYDLDSAKDSADLIVCCEVLEHLEEPDKALQVLQNVVSKYLILSVPREPLWRVLNVCRGKYLRELGNTPGHVRHWSRNSFTRQVEKYFTVLKVRSPFPWTMLLCEKSLKHG